MAIIAIAAGVAGFGASAWQFGGAVFLFSGAWAFLIAYFQKVQALLDLEGKIVALGATINLGGRALGPASAALLIHSDRFTPVVWYALIGFFLSFLLLLPALLKVEGRTAHSAL